MPDIVALLEAEHAQVRALLERLSQTKASAPRTREKLRARIKAAIQAHTQIEEKIFYPAFRKAAGEDEDEQMYLEAVDEHRLVDQVLRKLDADEPASNAFMAHAKLVKDLIEHHAQEEEEEMFPRAREVLDEEARTALAARAAARKKDLLAKRAA
jgi:hemerythrin superfamily protein